MVAATILFFSGEVKLKLAVGRHKIFQYYSYKRMTLMYWHDIDIIIMKYWLVFKYKCWITSKIQEEKFAASPFNSYFTLSELTQERIPWKMSSLNPNIIAAVSKDNRAVKSKMIFLVEVIIILKEKRKNFGCRMFFLQDFNWNWCLYVQLSRRRVDYIVVVI